MKRVILSAMVLVAMAFVSCEKTEPATPAEPGTCKLSGIAFADLDLSNDTTEVGTFIAGLNPEFVPSGVKLTFVVNSGDLDNNPDPSFDYQDLTYTATVGTNGAYSVTLPAIATALSVDVYFDDFMSSQRQYTADGSFESEDKTFFLGTMTVGGLINGISKIQNFTYNY
jgi:hypothetical protein